MVTCAATVKHANNMVCLGCQSKGQCCASNVYRGRLFFMSEQVQKIEAARGLMRSGSLLSEPFVQVQLDGFQSYVVQQLQS